MGAPATGREFLDLASRSQLISSEIWSKLTPQLTHHESGAPKRVATTLIKNQVITEYQARQLLAGKHKGFYLSKFKMLEVLGAGGMGKVFLAEQITMERLVAIKILGRVKRKRQEKEMLARFAREAKAVASLNHPNIVHAYDFDQENGLPFIVMEFVEGIDTARLVAKTGNVPWQQAADFGAQAASGLGHAHAAGLVHRDVKPANLLVDAEGTVKILDLGLCSAFDTTRDDSITTDQDQLGTVDYVAPEQALDSRNVDARADIYGLGATLYALVTGRPLFPDKSTAQKLLLHQTEAPTPIEQINPEVSSDLIAVITACLRRSLTTGISRWTKFARRSCHLPKRNNLLTTLRSSTSPCEL